AGAGRPAAAARLSGLRHCRGAEAAAVARAPRDHAPARFMLILRQGFAFLLVGGVQVLLDWLVFVLVSALGVPAFAANVCGRVAGASLGFWLNGLVTFRGAEQRALVGRPLRRFL